MTLKLHAVFDGTAFQPREPVSLAPNTECELTIETAVTPNEENISQQEVYALSAIAAMAVDMGVTDLADRHHEYAHPVVKED
jgi:hypothetical protein